MARIELTDTEWTDLSSELESGNTYWLQCNSTRNMEAENVYLTQSEPSNLKDGVLGHDFKFKFVEKLYVRSQTGCTSLKIEGVQ